MRTEKWKLPSVWVLGPIGLEETRGPPVFGVINAVLKVTARPKHVITRGGSVQCGLVSTATLGEQNFKWEKRPLESHGVVISMSKSNHQKFWFASPMLIGTLVTSVNPVKIYIYVNFNVKGLINFITYIVDSKSGPQSFTDSKTCQPQLLPGGPNFDEVLRHCARLIANGVGHRAAPTRLLQIWFHPCANEWPTFRGSAMIKSALYITFLCL